MTKGSPEISVILPVYNGGNYLHQSVQSVLDQSYSNYELLIIDDCSTDGSREYIENLESSFVRKFYNETNKGLFYNLNFLIKSSNSPLIKLWAQDDIMYSNCLEKFVLFHERYSTLGFSYSMCDHIDKKGILTAHHKTDHTPEIISTELHSRIAYYTGSIAGNISNVCITKQGLDKVGLFNETMKISADFDMWVRLARYFETGFIREPLIQLRDHNGQLSRNEKFYINHMKEDLSVYRYLDQYVEPSQKAEGHEVLKNTKLVFYFTLMIKAFLKGHFKLGREFYRELNGYYPITKVIYAFLKTKVFKTKPINAPA